MCLGCGRRIRLAGESKFPGYESVAPSPDEYRCFRCYYTSTPVQAKTPREPTALLPKAVKGVCRHCLRPLPPSNSGVSCSFGIDLWRKYKISCWDYFNLLNLQGGRCKICSISEDNFARKLHVDHDHNCCPGNRSCGKCIRGLLCPNCNIGLGKVKDDLMVIQSMINYLAVDTAL